MKRLLNVVIAIIVGVVLGLFIMGFTFSILEEDSLIYNIMGLIELFIVTPYLIVLIYRKLSHRETTKLSFRRVWRPSPGKLNKKYLVVSFLVGMLAFFWTRNFCDGLGLSNIGEVERRWEKQASERNRLEPYHDFWGKTRRFRGWFGKETADLEARRKYPSIPQKPGNDLVRLFCGIVLLVSSRFTYLKLYKRKTKREAIPTINEHPLSPESHGVSTKEFDTRQEKKIHFRCSNCQTKYSALLEQVGRKGKCKNCGKTIVVPY